VVGDEVHILLNKKSTGNLEMRSARGEWLSAVRERGSKLKVLQEDQVSIVGRAATRPRVLRVAG